MKGEIPANDSSTCFRQGVRSTNHPTDWRFRTSEMEAKNKELRSSIKDQYGVSLGALQVSKKKDRNSPRAGTYGPRELRPVQRVRKSSKIVV